MSKAQRFEDLTIFQMARDLCKEVYAITKEGEFHNDSRFVQQIHASAGSVMDNIAEGFERDGNKEFEREQSELAHFAEHEESQHS